MVNRPPRLFGAVLLAGIILLAGCSGLTATEQQPPTSQPTVENFSYPSGWSQEGMTNLLDVRQTHVESLANVSRTSRFVHGSQNGNRTLVRTIDTDAGTGSVRFIDSRLHIDRHTYYNSEGVFEYDKNTRELSRMPGKNWTKAEVATQRIQRPLNELEMKPTETVTVEGVTAIRYTVTGIKDQDSVPPNIATGYVTVTEEGYIAEYNIMRGYDVFTHQTVYDLSAVGNATVTRPVWMPDE